MESVDKSDSDGKGARGSAPSLESEQLAGFWVHMPPYPPALSRRSFGYLLTYIGNYLVRQ